MYKGRGFPYRQDTMHCAFAQAPPSHSLSESEISHVLDQLIAGYAFAGKRVLLIVPDLTRSMPLGVLFRGLHHRLAGLADRIDVLIALGTHPPLSEEAINTRLEITPHERQTTFAALRIFNHAWDEPESLMPLGTLGAAEISELTQGRFARPVAVEISRRIADYDVLLVVGPVFPHEVVGFSGGNKYFFPGISGPEILNFFHWLGAVVTNPLIIGSKWTPVRRVVDRAAALIAQDRLCLAAVVDGQRLAGLYAGTPESAWDAASELSAALHITRKPRPFHTVLSCAPLMYGDLWVAGKCMYKLEPVVADGGELIIYAPHLHEISKVHGRLLLEIGYHCRDYFLAQWPRFSGYPWGVLAHSTHVRGIGTYRDGQERPRIRVTLASAVPEPICHKINLGYRDPRALRPQDFADREEQGILLVPKAGEQLFHLENRPPWAGGGE